MILALALAQVAMVVPTPPLPDRNWEALPTLDYVRPPAAGGFVGFVAGEVRAGRCAAAVAVPGGWSLRVDVVVLATPDGQIRQAVPRAIQCPTVEQYASGLVSSFARANINTHGSTAPRWYRTSLSFTWPQ